MARYKARKTLGGYFTVEAAFIVPMIVCILALLCYLGLFMCNRCMLVQDAYILGLRGSILYGEDNNRVVSTVLAESEGLTDKYFAVPSVQKNVEAGMLSVSVTLSGEMKVPIAFYSWEDKKMDGTWELQETKTLDRTNPVTFIRSCRKVETVMN